MPLTFRNHDPTVALVHGVLLGFTFSILLPFGGTFYCLYKGRQPRLARNIHASIQCLGLLLAVVGTGLGVSMVKSIVSSPQTKPTWPNLSSPGKSPSWSWRHWTASHQRASHSAD